MPIVGSSQPTKPPIVKITQTPITPPLPLTDSDLSGTGAARAVPQDLDMAQDDAVQLSRVSSLADSDGVAAVDLEKVAALRQAIAGGSFQVDAEAIYDGLVADAREMLGSAPT